MEKNNNLSNLQRGGMLETLFLCLAPLLFWIIVKEVLCTSLFIALLLVIKYAMMKKANAKARGLVPSKYFYITFGGITAVIVAIMGYHMVFCHNNNTEEVNKQPETVETQPEEQKEEEVKADDKTDETSNATEGDPNARRTKNGTLDKHGKYTNPDGTLKDAITVKTEANNPNKAPAKAETTTGSTEDTIVDNSNAKADEKTEELIKEAKKDDTKKVEDYKSDIVVITTPAKEDKKVEETKSVDPAKDINVNEVEIKDIPSNENKAEETTISNEVEDDKVVEMDKDELAELFKNVKEEEKSEKAAPKAEEPKVEVKEDVETKTEAVVKTEEVVEETIVNEEAKGDVKVEEAVTLENETPVIEEKVEVKSIEAVKVTAIDGYNATVGSTIQFKVSGDDVKIDGLDGINYTFNNGILSVNTGSEATVLTVEASNSVNTVSFDITINGIAQ